MSEPIPKLTFSKTGSGVWKLKGHGGFEPIGYVSEEAHVREIVHRCNTWDALLSACKGLIAPGTVTEHGQAMQAAFTAIADAEKEIQ